MKAQLFGTIGLLLFNLSALGGCWVDTYWPLNHGDTRHFTNSATANSGVTVGTDYYSGSDWKVWQDSMDDYIYEIHRKVQGKVYFVCADTGWVRVCVDPPVLLFDDDLLKNGGYRTTQTTVTQSGVDYPATFTVTISMAGTVTAAAGTFSNCRNITVKETAYPPGQPAVSAEVMTGVLAPRVGLIKKRVVIYDELNDVDKLVWVGLVSGTVGGINVTNLAAQSGTLPPYVTTHPRNTTPTNNGVVTFTVAASGQALSYEWLKDGVPLSDNGRISGTITATLRIAPVQFSDSGNYAARVSNSACSVTSSNAVLTVVRDPVPPGVTITSPANGATTNTNVVRVLGTANDNIGLAEVLVKVNDRDWGSATGTTNWTFMADQLLPGPNTIQAKAVDLETNISTVVIRTFTYIVSAPLAVQMTGKGTLSPNLSNAVLAIGIVTNMTATAATGYAFTNWTGGTDLPLVVVTNGRTVRFIMQSNLVLQANFVDVQKPTVIITNPPTNARLSNAVVTFRGTAKDNGSLARVEYQLNGSLFDLATGTSNWSATVNLPAGTNIFRVKSTDATANESLVATRSVFFVVPSPLTLLINGNGSVTGATNGQLLEVGRGYTLKAMSALRHLFAGWSGDLSSSNPVLTFLMQSNLNLQANFVTNPFVGLKGTFYGLFSETNEVRNHDRSGSFTLTLAEAGSYSASFQLGAKKLSATGKFDWLGQSLLTLKPTLTNTVTVALQLDVTNLSTRVEGVVSNEAWMSPLLGYRSPVYAGTNLSALAGKYTLVIAGSDDAGNSPGGDGYGKVMVSKTGLLTLAGKLADGTVLSQSIPVSSDGRWALYAPLYTTKGSALGWMTFTNDAQSNINGELSWIKPALVTSKFYPLGFTNNLQAVGSRYVAPGTTNRVLVLTNGAVEFRFANLMQPFTNSVLLATNNKVINLSSNKLTMILALPSGLFSGTALDLNSGKTISFNGALLQSLNAGYGYFLGTNQSGEVRFEAAP